MNMGNGKRNFMINDFEVDIQGLMGQQKFSDGLASGQDFKNILEKETGVKHDKGSAVWVKEEGSNAIRHLDPDEVVPLDKIEKAGTTNPFNTAGIFSKGQQKNASIGLTVKEEDWQLLREHLFKNDKLERQSFMELGLLDVDGEIELFLHKLLLVPDSEYVTQSAVQVMPSGRFTVDAYNSFAGAGVAVHGHVHSHPFTSHAHFSGVDLDCRQKMMGGILAVIKAFNIEGSFFSLLMVMGSDPCGWHAELVGPDNAVIGQIEKVTVISPTGMKRLIRSSISPSTADDWMTFLKKGMQKSHEKTPAAYLDRNIRLLGDEGQDQIATMHLALCGVGGVGAMLVANLRGMGFRKFTLIDPELLEASNLNRFPGAGPEDIGDYKVNIIQRELQRLDSKTKVNALDCGVGEDQARVALYDADIIIAGVDGLAPKAELQVLAARLLKPLFDIGTGIRLDAERNVKKMGGQVIAYLPGGPCLRCQGINIFRPETGLAGSMRRATGYVEDTDLTPTSVAFINSVAAGLAADMVVSYITGLRQIPTYIEFDQWSWKVTTYNYARRPQCSICGHDGIEGKGIMEQKICHKTPKRRDSNQYRGQNLED
jgi:molybdopterin/thiamine biosynthesis adenylyltransferase